MLKKLKGRPGRRRLEKYSKIKEVPAALTCSPRAPEMHPEFEAGLVYTVSTQPAWATAGDKKQNRDKEKESLPQIDAVSSSCKQRQWAPHL